MTTQQLNKARNIARYHHSPPELKTDPIDFDLMNSRFFGVSKGHLITEDMTVKDLIRFAFKECMLDSEDFESLVRSVVREES
jgi:hypothetical protein